ncbi:Outer membrane protein TolC [Desulfuromusa kysingii]|uniref:Outer membrane protein TolC n=1 Tax=Desulfuromusa kysingii TaxID=37625 RepID=A0A1H3WS21_9BACT|nr:TolC family protein [Desulfuromusa kysingii]SDZ89760.1 Outer membrane protein TolC [Desulfuromusa kysingii]
MKFISVFAALVSLCFTVSAMAEQPTDPPLLAELLTSAEQNNPTLHAAQEQVGIAAARIDQVSALPDPQLSISLLNYPTNNLRNDTSPMTGNDFKLSQMLPFPGKLATRGNLAQQQKLWTQAKYADLVLQIRQQVRDHWYQLSFQKQAIILTQANIALLDDVIRLTETRYQVGKGLQQNVLKAQVERSLLYDRLLGLQADAEISQAQLVSLTGGSPELVQKKIPVAAKIAVIPTLNNLMQQARDNRPLFAAFDALITQEKQRIKLAKLDYRPDINLWASYRFRSDTLADGGDDSISAGFSINLPFPVAKRRAALSEAESALRLAYRQRDEFSRQVDFELHRNLARLQQAQKLINLYSNGVIPQAEQTYHATMAAYRVDKVDFLALTDSLMTLYRYRIDQTRAQSDAHRSLARLRATAGLDQSTSAKFQQLKKDGPHA